MSPDLERSPVGLFEGLRVTPLGLLNKSAAAVCAGIMLWVIRSAAAEPAHLIAQGKIQPDAIDRSNETIGGIGSGLAYDSRDDVVFALSDRGPGDGTIDYCPRFDVLRLTQSSENRSKLNIELLKTVLLRDREGKNMTGLIPEVSDKPLPQLRDGRICIDPEAIALAPDGTLYVSDEYGPMLYHFDREGRMIRFLSPPMNYLPRTSNGTVNFASDKIASGRVPNHGFEGLALSTDGKTANLILQSGLIQDGGKNGRLTRILAVDLTSEQAVAEYAYQLTDVLQIQGRGQKKHNRLKQNDLSVSELTTLDTQRFLALERDNFGANGDRDFKRSIYKCIFAVDIGQATNLLSLPGRPFDQQPGSPGFQPLSASAKFKPAAKALVINFAEAPPLSTNEFAAKWEGIALLAGTSAGHRQMLVACDNDFLNPSLKIKIGRASCRERV